MGYDILASPEAEMGLSCPDGNHPHEINLGLPSGTKWACCNVGASKPESDGGYYSWGETSVKNSYAWRDYNYRDSSNDHNMFIGWDISETSYDVAHVKWGGSWKMPTKTQCEELINNCNFEFTNINGTNVCKVTGKNGGVIFIPASGAYIQITTKSELLGKNDVVNIWSSSAETADGNSYLLYFSHDGIQITPLLSRAAGLSVRPIKN